MRSREEMAAEGKALGAAQVNRADEAGLSPRGQGIVSLATAQLTSALQNGIGLCGTLDNTERGPAVLHFLRNAHEGLALLDRISDEILKELGQ